VREGAFAAAVVSAAGGFVVFSVNRVAGWSATVDGVAQPLYEADDALMGLPVAAGRHSVALTYRVSAWPWVIAWIAALVGFAALAQCPDLGKERASARPSP
jgi:uncharacterized membrane protein YfhO